MRISLLPNHYLCASKKISILFCNKENAAHTMSYEKEINRRKTFAIISHPDAGKTTLTEKFLLFGGAIQTAGAVKSNK